MALLRSIATVGGYTMASRVLGFVRDVLVAAYLGAGPVADAFVVAFKLPNFFRRLFAEGAFNAAYVPVFAGRLETDGETRARYFAEEVLAVLLAVLLLFVTALQIAMPWVMLVLAPGFADQPEKFDLAVHLARITFPYLLFISLVSLMGGVLNSLGRFAAAAAAPIMLNVCMIAAVVGLTPYTKTPGHALAYGVTAAGVTQFVWLVYSCHAAGMHLRLIVPRLTPGVKRVLTLMIPGAIGAGVIQVNLFIDVIIASFLPGGSVSYLYYADRINELPLGVIGIAIGTALLPLMSRQIRAGQDQAAMASLNRALELGLLVTLPAAAALLVLATPIIAVLFERGAFGPAETAATAAALAAYSLGLPAYVVNKALTPAFYARQDTATPVKIAAVVVFANTAFAVALMQVLAHVGIALATALSSWLSVVMLAVTLRRRGHFAVDPRLRSRAPRSALAAAGMAAVLWLGMWSLAGPLAGSPLERGLALAALIAAGLVAYALLALVLGAAGRDDLKRLARRGGGPT
ncbi:MAG: murein biosynthesis integral membrane protein MurJ [Rhodospirillales bacterium]